MRLIWRRWRWPTWAIMISFLEGNPAAALALDDDFEAKAELARQHPKIQNRARAGNARDRGAAELCNGLPHHRGR